MRRALTFAAGPFFLVAGALHFVRPSMYIKIMPPWLPAHRELVFASGVAEAAGGAGLLSGSPRTRRLAGWWLVATLTGILPANLHMALHPETFPKVPGGAPVLWGRLPVQMLLARWVLGAARR
jgi:uncharacterized membrane protein